jgi:N-formylglutamate amidohydrolase
MGDEAAAALERLQHIFASLHATREAKIDEVCTPHSRALLTDSTERVCSGVLYVRHCSITS